MVGKTKEGKWEGREGGGRTNRTQVKAGAGMDKLRTEEADVNALTPCGLRLLKEMLWHSCLGLSINASITDCRYFEGEQHVSDSCFCSAALIRHNSLKNRFFGKGLLEKNLIEVKKYYLNSKLYK